MTDLAEIYKRVSRNGTDLDAHETFTVRQWDGMDGCWTDCATDVTRDEALRIWGVYTQLGTKAISYDEIDYYAIFPGGTRMLWDGSEGSEMFR